MVLVDCEVEVEVAILSLSPAVQRKGGGAMLALNYASDRPTVVAGVQVTCKLSLLGKLPSSKAAPRSEIYSTGHSATGGW